MDLGIPHLQIKNLTEPKPSKFQILRSTNPWIWPSSNPFPSGAPSSRLGRHVAHSERGRGPPRPIRPKSALLRIHPC